jgi:uncharacterized RDD family membrane protein YckC
VRSPGPEFNPYAPPAAEDAQAARPDDPRPPPLALRRDRFIGAVIDTIAVMAILKPLEYVAGRIGTTNRVVWAAVDFAIWVALNGYFLVERSQTLGKRLLGLQIVNFADGRPTSFAKIAFFRTLPMMILTVAIPTTGTILYIFGLTFIFLEYRRCLHDVIAGTKVVDLRAKRHSPLEPSGTLGEKPR